MIADAQAYADINACSFSDKNNTSDNNNKNKMTGSRLPEQIVTSITVATRKSRCRFRVTRAAVDGFIRGRYGPLFAVVLAATLPVEIVRADFDSGLKAFGEGRLDEARQAWQQSAVEGHAMSQYLLAELYEDGNGVAADLVEAHRWYCAAAAGGYTGAAEECTRLADVVQTRVDTDAETDSSTQVGVDLEIADNDTPTRASPDSGWPGDSFAPGVADQRLPAGSLQLVEVVHSHPGNPESAPQPETKSEASEAIPSQYGLMGRNTRLAVIAFKKRAGLEVNDKIDDEALQAVRQKLAQTDVGVPVAADANHNSTATTPLSTGNGSDW